MKRRQYMTVQEIKQNLCYYDERNPDAYEIDLEDTDKMV
jgi:hypothetical protein